MPDVWPGYRRAGQGPVALQAPRAGDGPLSRFPRLAGLRPRRRARCAAVRAHRSGRAQRGRVGPDPSGPARSGRVTRKGADAAASNLGLVRKLLVAGIAALLLLSAAPALAQTDPTYPVQSATDWTTGAQNDSQNGNYRGQYV